MRVWIAVAAVFLLAVASAARLDGQQQAQTDDKAQRSGAAFSQNLMPFSAKALDGLRQLVKPVELLVESMRRHSHAVPTAAKNSAPAGDASATSFLEIGTTGKTRHRSLDSQPVYVLPSYGYANGWSPYGPYYSQQQQLPQYYYNGFNPYANANAYWGGVSGGAYSWQGYPPYQYGGYPFYGPPFWWADAIAQPGGDSASAGAGADAGAGSGASTGSGSTPSTSGQQTSTQPKTSTSTTKGTAAKQGFLEEAGCLNCVFL